MPSSTDNVKLGVCTVLFDGTDLGYTKGGVEVTVETQTHEVKVDQFGETPVGELINGRKVSVKVPMAETTLENLVKIMPGARLVTDAGAAQGTVTFSTAAPVTTDKVTVGGINYTFLTAPTPGNVREMAIPATFGAAAAALAAAINADGNAPFTATVAAGVVTIKSDTPGLGGNLVTLAKTAATPANITTSGATLTGGTAATKAKVVSATGININLLTIAKKLVLRPIGTAGAEDFVVHKAATPGGMQFAYKHDDERVFNADFKGYPDANGDLFTLGDETAV